MRKIGTIAGLTGLIMIVSSLIVYAIRNQMTTPLVAVLWGGGLLILFFFYASFGNLRNLLSKRTTKYGANMMIMILIFLTIVVIVSVISTMHKQRIDLTKAGRYTLSDQTLKILKSLKRDVEVTAFYRQDQRNRQEMYDLLQEYSYHSPRFKYQFIDPDRHPEQTLKYGITEYRVTLVKSGNNQEKLGFESEEKLTNAILKVMRDEVKVIYFLKGHGENDVTSQGKDGYKAAKDAMEKENFQVKELVLLSEPEVPYDTSVLVVSGSKKEFIPEEVEKLTRFIGRGGRVLFMIDPGTTPVIVDLIKTYGFQVGDDIIIDKLSQVFGANYLTPVVTEYDKEHPITRDFSPSTFFALARSVGIENNPRTGAYTLAKTSDNSWAETSLSDIEKGRIQYDEGKDTAGPVPLAAVTAVKLADEAAEAQQHEQHDPLSITASSKKYAKLVVFGDSDFANNTHINLAGNGDLFLNTVNWLAEEGALISVRRRNPDNTPVVLTTTQGRVIFWIPVIVIPSFVIIAGIGVYTRKRWRG